MVQLDITLSVLALSNSYRSKMYKVYREKVLDELDKVLADVKKYEVNGEIQLCKKVRGVPIMQESIQYKRVVKYIKRIKGLYDILQDLNSTQYKRTIKGFSNLVPAESIGKKLYDANNKTVAKSISSRIVDAMQYETVREKVFPSYVRNLGIKSCVYCNANFTIADKDGNGYFDLDHWQPKSHYPFLCTSFYNLQPSCPACNRRKSADISNLYFSLWKDPSRKIAPVIKFVLDETSLINYLINGFTAQTLHLNIEAATPEDRYVCSNMKQKFHLETLYAEHRDVLEEIVWKCLFYRPSYLEGLRKAFGINLSPDDVLRMGMGVYPSEKDVHKRPLSKMIQDVAKQLKLY